MQTVYLRTGLYHNVVAIRIRDTGVGPQGRSGHEIRGMTQGPLRIAAARIVVVVRDVRAVNLIRAAVSDETNFGCACRCPLDRDLVSRQTRRGARYG
ncbi:MAG: hypothetical protein IPP40_15030 [bacterium]|nr:hypothetical protein [bacterium]